MKSPEYPREVIRATYGRYYPEVDLSINDPEDILRNEEVVPMVTELITNCIEQGATRITVTIEGDGISVSDDVCHPNAPELLSNLNAPNPRSSKWERGEIGGAGIRSIHWVLLKQLGGGSLTYEATPQGQIIARVSWAQKPQPTQQDL